MALQPSYLEVETLMEKTPDGGAILSAADLDGVRYLLLAEQMRVVSIHATTFTAINELVDEWERVMGKLPEPYR